MANTKRRHIPGMSSSPHQLDAFTASLDTRLSTVEDGFDKISQGLAGLDTKFGRELRSLEDRVENSISGFAGEMRSSLEGLKSQLNDRQKTPWGTIGSLGGILTVLIGAFVHQALDPIHSDIEKLKEINLPRAEYEARERQNLAHIARSEEAIKLLDQRAYDDMQRQLSDLRKKLAN